MPNKAQIAKYQPHILLPENESGRDFIVSDIHGHRQKLEDQLAQLNFSTEHDRLICVGDLIDRGPESAACLELLEKPWFWSVLGNHEQMLIETLEHQTDALWSRWLTNGGSWVLDQPDDDLNTWSTRLKQLPLSITIACQEYTVGICHAEYNGDHWGDRYDASTETSLEWLWGRSRLKSENQTRISGVDWLFNGHTIVSSIRILGNSVFIEQGAYLENPLTIIDLQQFLIEGLPARQN